MLLSIRAPLQFSASSYFYDIHMIISNLKKKGNTIKDNHLIETTNLVKGIFCL